MVEEEARDNHSVEIFDPPLLAWKMEEGAMSQGTRAASRSWQLPSAPSP